MEGKASTLPENRNRKIIDAKHTAIHYNVRNLCLMLLYFVIKMNYRFLNEGVLIENAEVGAVRDDATEEISTEPVMSETSNANISDLIDSSADENDPADISTDEEAIVFAN
jgi:hypothetical protein